MNIKEYQEKALRTKGNYTDKRWKKNNGLKYMLNLIKERKWNIKEDGSIWANWNEVEGWLIKPRRKDKLMPNGYYTVRVMHDNKEYCVMSHRLVYAYYHGYIADDLVINHKDFNRKNNCIENLELVTQKENVDYTVKYNPPNYAKGIKHYRCKLSDNDVSIIRAALKYTDSLQKDIAKVFGVRTNQISRIKTGDRRKMNGLTLNEYQSLATRTLNKDLSKEECINNMLLGMCGEIGEVIGNRIEGEYIKYKTIIPEDYRTSVQMETKPILDVLKDYKKNKFDLVKLNFQTDNLTIKANNETASIEEKLCIKLQGKPIEIAFNTSYLIDGLSTYKVATLKITSNVSPMVLEEENKLDLVLPVRIIN